MTYFSAKEISDLDNSMVAAQNVKLGTVLDYLVDGSGSTSASKVVSSGLSPSAPSTVVASGLSSITSVVVGFAGMPTTRHQWTSACVVGTNIWLTCYEGTASGSIITPVLSTGSASGHFSRIYWIAMGPA